MTMKGDECVNQLSRSTEWCKLTFCRNNTGKARVLEQILKNSDKASYIRKLSLHLNGEHSPLWNGSCQNRVGDGGKGMEENDLNNKARGTGETKYLEIHGNGSLSQYIGLGTLDKCSLQGVPDKLKLLVIICIIPFSVTVHNPQPNIIPFSVIDSSRAILLLYQVAK